jgi:hypothetical protein
MGRVHFTKDNESLGGQTNEVLQSSGAKGASTTEYVNRFEKTGFSGSVGAAHQGEARVEIQNGRLQAAEIRYLQPAEAQAYSLIGITT